MHPTSEAKSQQNNLIEGCYSKEETGCPSHWYCAWSIWEVWQTSWVFPEGITRTIWFICFSDWQIDFRFKGNRVFLLKEVVVDWLCFVAVGGNILTDSSNIRLRLNHSSIFSYRLMNAVQLTENMITWGTHNIMQKFCNFPGKSEKQTEIHFRLEFKRFNSRHKWTLLTIKICLFFSLVKMTGIEKTHKLQAVIINLYI